MIDEDVIATTDAEMRAHAVERDAEIARLKEEVTRLGCEVSQRDLAVRAARLRRGAVESVLARVDRAEAENSKLSGHIARLKEIIAANPAAAALAVATNVAVRAREDEIALLKMRIAKLMGGSEVVNLAGCLAVQQNENARLRRALAAGPAALRALRSDDYSLGYVTGLVEAAQEAALKGGG